MSTKPDAKPQEPGAGARLLTDLGPLVIFFAANAWRGIFTATAAFMVAIVVAIGFSAIRHRRVSPILWFSAAMVLALGGLTIWLHNETFIKVKPTIYYATVSGILGFGLLTGRNYLKVLLGSAYPGLSERGWQLLARNWAVFFAIMAVLNEVVWRSTTTSFWIGTKLWGFLPATLLFAIANVPMLMRHGFELEQAVADPPVPPSQ